MSNLSRPVLTLSVVAGEDVKAYRFIGADGEYPAAAAAALGVTRHDAKDTERVDYTLLGTATIEAGGAYALGAELKSDATGRAVDRDNAGVVTAVALEAAAAAGDLTECLVQAKGT